MENYMKIAFGTVELIVSSLALIGISLFALNITPITDLGINIIGYTIIFIYMAVCLVNVIYGIKIFRKSDDILLGILFMLILFLATLGLLFIFFQVIAHTPYS